MKNITFSLLIAMIVASVCWANPAGRKMDSIQNSTGGAVLAVPSVGTQLLTDTGSATVTNKTISGGSNTFSNIPPSAVSSGTTPGAFGVGGHLNFGSAPYFDFRYTTGPGQIDLWDDTLNASVLHADSADVVTFAQQIHASGGIKIPVSPVSGYVLTSDSSGNGTWQADMFASGGTMAGLLTVPSFRLSTSPVNGYVMTSDSSGNATWKAATGGLPAPLDSSTSYTSNYEGSPGSFLGNVSDVDQTNQLLVLGTTDTSTIGNNTSAVMVGTGDVTTSSGGGYSGILTIRTGDVSFGATGHAGPLNILGGGSATSPATVTIKAGDAFANVTSGDLNLKSGGNGIGSAGTIKLTTGTGSSSTRGVIEFQDGSETSPQGSVWALNGGSGRGHWQDQLLDSSASLSVDWENRQLSDGSGTVLDWSAGGNVTLTSTLKIQDGSQGTTGNVWTSTDAFGSGHWAAPSGGAITHFAAYTPTFSGFYGNTNVNFYFRRVGDAYEVQGSFIVGLVGGFSFTVTSANATAGATYTDAGSNLFTVAQTIAGSTTLKAGGNNLPSVSSGTLIKTGGTGDATISYSASTAEGAGVSIPLAGAVDTTLITIGNTITASGADVGDYTSLNLGDMTVMVTATGTDASTIFISQSASAVPQYGGLLYGNFNPGNFITLKFSVPIAGL